MMKPSSAGWVFGGLEEICPVLWRGARKARRSPGGTGHPAGGRGQRGSGSSPAKDSSARPPAEPVSSWPSGGRTARGCKAAGSEVQSAISIRRPDRPRSQRPPLWARLTLSERLTSLSRSRSRRGSRGNAEETRLSQGRPGRAFYVHTTSTPSAPRRAARPLPYAPVPGCCWAVQAARAGRRPLSHAEART